MANIGISRKDQNKHIRQEAERERLVAYGHITQVFENLKKLQDLDTDLDGLKIQRLKAANEAHLKLINKYLPDLKAMELSQDPQNPLFEMSRDEREREITELLKTIGSGAGAVITTPKGPSATH